MSLDLLHALLTVKICMKAVIVNIFKVMHDQNLPYLRYLHLPYTATTWWWQRCTRTAIL